jgi:hypothetical protein
MTATIPIEARTMNGIHLTVEGSNKVRKKGVDPRIARANEIAIARSSLSRWDTHPKAKNRMKIIDPRNKRLMLGINSMGLSPQMKRKGRERWLAL